MLLGDQCPMYFDDGTNPWQQTDVSMFLLDVGLASQVRSFSKFNLIIVGVMNHVVFKDIILTIIVSF